MKRSSKKSGVDSARYHDVGNVEDLTAQNVRAIVQLERAAQADRSVTEKIAHRVVSFCGSVHFLWIHVLWFAAWLTFNMLPGGSHPDPYPFTFLTMIVSLEAIFLSTFILISQREETRLSERRNALDLQINLLSEQENTKVLRMLERISQHLGLKPEADPSLAVLEQATRPDRLAEQIDRASGPEHKGR